MEIWRHKEKFPPEMQAYFYSRWDSRALWELVVPSDTLPISELEWHLHYPFWSTSPPESIFDLRPRSVLDNPSKYSKHWDRTEAADLQYPILVGHFGQRLVILDGHHRLLKSIKTGASFIECKIVAPEHIRVAA